jgi:hypothetical protein
MMHRLLTLLILLTISTILPAQNTGFNSEQNRRISIFDSTKSNYQPDIALGNPTNKDVEMAMDDAKAPYYRYEIIHTKPWFDFKKQLNNKTGIQLTLNYSSAFIGASDRLTENSARTAASGIFDATVKWDIVNRNRKNKGSLILWLDARHLYYGDVTPQFFNFEAGTALFPALKFNKWNFRALEFYYQQVIFEQAAIVIGKIDMPDWFNFNTLLHPMKHFTSLAFSVNPTVSWSNPGFGIVAGGWIDKDKQFGIIAGLNDVAGDDLSTSKFFDMGTAQWANGKFLKMLELLYTPKRELQYFNRISATFWHSDELTESDESFFTSPGSKGFSIQTSWVINEKFIPIFTFGLSDGDGANSLSKLNISLAHAWFFQSYDMLGIGLNYTRSTLDGSRAQLLADVFYRYTWSVALAITPTFKMVMNPALNPDKDVIFYYGIRTRISM